MFASVLQTLLLMVYAVVLAVVVIYAIHRYALVYLYYRNRRNLPAASARFDELPRVTIQLPMFNEPYVAARIIEASCKMTYPRDKLQIQVLDDSTDRTTQIASETVARMQRVGHDIQLIHRAQRSGYKAGALAEGLEQARGDFVAIFDADFVPEPDLLMRAVHFFADPKVGMVQARWSHLNRDQSLLTRGQAIFLDGHFMIEHTARNRSGRFMSFNGTAGVWRKQCINDAGGWHHDTLTEDLDLSYRAQLRGWNFVFVPEVISPAELPPEISAFKAQQYRWTKGGVQTAKKLLPQILRAPLSLKIKVEAFFHLTNAFVYPFMLVLTVLLFPALVVQLRLAQQRHTWLVVLVNVALFLVGSCSAGTFYMCSQREIYRTWIDKLKYLPFLMALGVGIALNNARAVLEGLFDSDCEFVRTPKYGVIGADPRHSAMMRPIQNAAQRGCRTSLVMPILELALGCYLGACAIALMVLYQSASISIPLPFMVIFMSGYFYVGVLSLRSALGVQRTTSPDSAGAPLPAG